IKPFTFAGCPANRCSRTPLAHWDGTPETEEAIKAETKATIRCIPLDAPYEPGKCIYSGKPSNHRVVFARSY
ncbi:MAG: hypothetical protein LUF87_10310, partial [Alistipes sp.]|nr:hypothetical protein [Alistipes sp.]